MGKTWNLANLKGHFALVKEIQKSKFDKLVKDWDIIEIQINPENISTISVPELFEKFPTRKR